MLLGQVPSYVPTHTAGTVRKLVNAKRTLVHFYVVAWTVCKSSAHDATLKLEAFCASFLMTQEVKPAEFHPTCPRNRRFSQERASHLKLSLVCADLEAVGKNGMNYGKAVACIRQINALATVFCFVSGVVLIV